MVLTKKTVREPGKIIYNFNKRINDITLKRAQDIVETKANAVGVEELYNPPPDDTHAYVFYDKDNNQVGTYVLEEKNLVYVDKEQQKKKTKKPSKDPIADALGFKFFK